MVNSSIVSAFVDAVIGKISGLINSHNTSNSAHSSLFDDKAPTSHASSSSTYGLGTTANYGHVKTINGLTQSSHSNGTALSAYQGKVLKDAIDAKPDSSDIPTKTSDLTNDSNYISTSSTAGLIKNDGTIDTNTYLTQLKIGTTNGLPVKTGTNGVLTTGSFGTSSGTFAEGNHTHSGYASSTHTHGNLQSNGQVGSTAQANKNVVTDSNGKITTENKPTIPTAVSDLTNDSDFTTINDVLEYISENATLTIPTTGDDAGYLVLTIQ